MKRARPSRAWTGHPLEFGGRRWAEPPVKPRLYALFFDRLDIQTFPKIPASNRAIRSPRFRDFQHHRRFRPLTFFVMLLDGSLHAVIANGQNIRTPQGEHQEHVRRPNADALDLGEMRDDRKSTRLNSSHLG